MLMVVLMMRLNIVLRAEVPALVVMIVLLSIGETEGRGL